MYNRLTCNKAHSAALLAVLVFVALVCFATLARAVQIGQPALYGLGTSTVSAPSLQIYGWVNGKAKGMVCDGATDDSAALSAAITAAQASPGTGLQLPPGTCELLSNVKISGSVPITIQGAGIERNGQNNARTTLQAGTGDTGSVLTLGDGTNTLQNMVLRDFAIDANSIAANCLDFANHGADYLLAQNWDCQHATDNGIAWKTSAANVNVTFDNVTSHHNTHYGLFVVGTFNNFRIFGGQFFSNYPTTGGAQASIGTGSGVGGNVSVYGTDFECDPAQTGTCRGVLITGAHYSQYGGYCELHGGSASDCWQVQANTNGAVEHVIISGARAAGNNVANNAIQLPAASSTSNIDFEANAISATNFLAAPPITGQTGTNVKFRAVDNDWIADTLPSLAWAGGADLTEINAPRSSISGFWSGASGTAGARFGVAIPTKASHIRNITCYAQTAPATCATPPVVEANVGNSDVAATACNFANATNTCSATGLSAAITAGQTVEFDWTTTSAGCGTEAQNINCALEVTTD